MLMDLGRVETVIVGGMFQLVKSSKDVEFRNDLSRKFQSSSLTILSENFA